MQPYLKFHNPRTFEDLDKPIPNFKKFGLKAGEVPKFFDGVLIKRAGGCCASRCLAAEQARRAGTRAEPPRASCAPGSCSRSAAQATELHAAPTPAGESVDAKTQWWAERKAQVEAAADQSSAVSGAARLGAAGSGVLSAGAALSGDPLIGPWLSPVARRGSRPPLPRSRRRLWASDSAGVPAVGVADSGCC
jgi:hypothetical protein